MGRDQIPDDSGIGTDVSRERFIVGLLPLTNMYPGQGEVSIGEWGLPECSRHGAMNRVTDKTDWWRCLACNIGVECKMISND